MEVISLYEMEVSPIKILSLMKNNIYNYYKEQTIINIDKTYTLQRKTLISLIHNISNKMGFKSQTFFLAVNYLDIIFSKKNNSYSYNYGLLAVACLIIASKYCENVPLRPIFKYFVSLYNNEVQDSNYLITKDILFNYEIIICKLLDYKLNYYTIYDFNFFFFGNGIIKIEQLKEINFDIPSIYNENDNLTENLNTSSNIKKILIKIYERSRHYLDVIIENLICLKYNSLLISICIMEKSIDYVLLHEFNLINIEDSIDIEQIQINNKKYFRQIMKEFYKIDYESLPEYEFLNIDCKNYKIFDDIYDNNDTDDYININLNQSNNIMHLSQINNNINSNNYLDNNSSTKVVNIIESSFNHSPNNMDTKEKINYLYKKVNIPVNSQTSNNNKYNIAQIRKKNTPKKRINSSRDNNFKYKEKTTSNNINNINSNILTTFDNFYKKDKNNIRNSLSINKNNNNNYYLKKCNTSSSPFKKASTKNMKHFNKKTKLLSKIKNKKKIDDSEERLNKNESNSIDKKNIIKVNNNNNLISKKHNNNTNTGNVVKPYVKKIIQNYECTQEDNNKLRDKKNLNININNKILYDEKNDKNKNKDRNKSTKKIIISKYLNNSNYSMIRGKSLIHKSKSKSNINTKYESSPMDERNSSNSKRYNNYIPFKFNKNNCIISDNKINHNNLKSNFFNELEKSNNNINSIIINENNSNNKSPNPKSTNDYKIKSNLNVYNSNLTSRNSVQYTNHNIKLIDSLMNVKMNYINNDGIEKPEKNITTTSIINYNHINKKSKKKEYLNNYSALNALKNKNKKNYIVGVINETSYKNNKTINETNYIESYRNKIPNLYQFENDINSNINVNEFNENDNYIENKDEIKNENKDRKHKSISNINLLDYSTGASNEKNVY